MSASNPFYERGMIRDPQRVFDREEELKTIFGWLRNMQGVSIVGERRGVYGLADSLLACHSSLITAP